MIELLWCVHVRTVLNELPGATVLMAQAPGAAT
jgi:hypothetical protein